MLEAEAEKESNAKTPLDVPWIEPEAIAPAVVFLASDADKAYGKWRDASGGDSCSNQR